MSYIIGTEGYLSTWGAFRSVLFTNGTTLYPPYPNGFVLTSHNKVFPPAPGVSPYTPPYFTPDSGTLVRQDPFGLFTPYIYFDPAPYEPQQPQYWSGYISVYLDHKDFLYMVGKTLTAAATSATINASAETYPGQYLYTSEGQDWGYGLTGVEKFKVVT